MEETTEKERKETVGNHVCGGKAGGDRRINHEKVFVFLSPFKFMDQQSIFLDYRGQVVEAILFRENFLVLVY
jgi:hypothetical protein